MRESIVETLLGVVVVAVAAIFLWFSLSAAGESSNGQQYEVLARFNNVSGVERGTDVRMAGIKVGVVKTVEYDPERFEARLRLSIDPSIALPDDSDARIVSDGLLGGAYVGIEPGGSFDNIALDGSGEIIYTRGAVDLLTLFASFAGGGDSGDEAATGADTGAGAASGGSLDGLDDYGLPPVGDDADIPAGDGE